jgi:cell wall-associated NlpC family hydrolase
MSIQAAVGRIDQILALQQQLTDPALATSSASATGIAIDTTSSGGASLTGGGTSFATQLATAQSAAATPATSPLATSPLATSPLASSLSAGASGGVSLGGGAGGQQVQAMVAEADSLLGKPYVYGGGHSGWGPQAGYDCSGFVSAVLHAGGYLSSPVDTTALPSQPGMESGPGQYVTVYDRAQPGQSGHVIIEINGQFYESGGRHGAWGGGGGVQKIAQPSPAYLSTFETVLHPAGL